MQGVAFPDLGSVHIDDVIVDLNQITANGPAPQVVGGNGGGIFVNGGSAEIVGNWIMNNSWPTGGGVAVTGTGTVVRTNRILDNQATAGPGGGVLVTGYSDAAIVQNMVFRNTAALLASFHRGAASLGLFDATARNRGPAAASPTPATGWVKQRW